MGSSSASSLGSNGSRLAQAFSPVGTTRSNLSGVAESIEDSGPAGAIARDFSIAPAAANYNQRFDSELERRGFFVYCLVLPSQLTDLTMTWRSAGCLTNGQRIPISLFGNSTSLTALVRPVDA